MGEKAFFNLMDKSFFSRNALEVAKDVLGKQIVRITPSGILSGRIVEVEAYRGDDDPASHAFRRLTARNKIMYGEPGLAYVYFTYGVHHCLNIVVEEEGNPAAVLIRALEPLSGIDIMKKNRGRDDINVLTDGPGKLTKACGITVKENGVDLTCNNELFIAALPYCEFDVEVSSRIGIKSGRDKLWRFYIRGSNFVSKR